MLLWEPLLITLCSPWLLHHLHHGCLFPQPETFSCVLHDVIHLYLALLVNPSFLGHERRGQWEWWGWADIGLSDLRDLFLP